MGLLNFITMYIQSYPQYGLGSWLKKNAGAIGTVAGFGVGAALAPFTGGASLLAAGALGSQLGGSVGGAVQGADAQKTAQEAQAEQMAQIQQQQGVNAKLSQLPQQQQYNYNFANGGMISSYQNGSVLGSQEAQPGYQYVETPNYKPISKRTFYLENLKSGAIPQGTKYSQFAKDQSSFIPDTTSTYAPYKMDSGKFMKNFPQIQMDATDIQGNPALIDSMNIPKGQMVGHGGIEMANGGQLNQEPTIYENGGTHRENPIGGIPLGNMGQVEEGEVRHGDYIFSQRLPYSKKS